MIVRTRFAPKGYCLNLFGLYLARDTSWIDRYVVNHERIHDAQQRELLYVAFYLLYVLEWIVRLVQYRHRRKAYRNISFEREAYSHGRDLSYLPHRRRYAWLRYLRP
ncbi:MAG: hypothetical protein K2L21_04995 [Muribaculaceae bacterium]|nr:hypothetical protein [Muribaculaceae bacterium]